jgi:ubiquinone/menaquinone biosynthesis C-methylase UbiE
MITATKTQPTLANAPPGDVWQVPCENCGAQPLEKYVTIQSVMWHCPHCDLYQKNHVFKADQYDLDYQTSRGYVNGRRRKLRTAAVRLSRIAGLLDTAQPKLLDIGCSLGYTVEAGSRLGWDAHGVDINDEMVDLCQKRGLNCRRVSEDGLPYPDDCFDAVTAWHVIEHVPDVLETLREWSRVLKPGGILAMETPDSSCWKLKWRGPNYRNFWVADHVYTFNQENLTPFVESAGLEVVPPPLFGKLSRLSPGLAAYCVGYRAFTGVQKGLGLSKVFQLFCRRKGAVEQAVTPARAA